MPVYVAECGTCGNKQDLYRTVEQRDTDLPECCGATMYRVIAATHAVPDIQEYLSPISHKLVSGRRQRREDLKRTQCREVDPSEKRSFLKPKEFQPVKFYK